MKKILSVLAILLAVAVQANAQIFKASPEGVVSEKDGKDYIVLEVKDATAHDLYQRAYQYVVEHYRNPDKVINIMGEQVMNIHCAATDAYRCRGIGNMADVDMNIVLQFKDGRYKISIHVNDQIVRSFYKLGGVRFTSKEHPEYGPTVTMFNLDGSVNSKIAVKNFNSWINSYITPLIVWMAEKHDGTGSSNDDW